MDECSRFYILELVAGMKEVRDKCVFPLHLATPPPLFPSLPLSFHSSRFLLRSSFAPHPPSFAPVSVALPTSTAQMHFPNP